ncbi:MAG: chorismate-binding protein, partial [Acidobacteria bacterium]|nr:chorismate-binding protein [Acidobacteriota bacterium]
MSRSETAKEVPIAEARQAVAHRREFLADSLTPLAIYRRLQSLSQHRFLLESVAGGVQVSRFSFLGAEPSKICRIYPGRVEIEAGGSRRTIEGPPLETLRHLLDEIRAEADSIPFSGGWVGNFGYDTIRLVEHLPNRPPDPFGLPFATLARFDNVVVFDHARQRVVAIANEIEGDIDPRAAEENLDRLATLLTAEAQGGAVAVPSGSIPVAETAPPSLNGEEYQAAVRKAKEYIVAGDIFQVVLSQTFEMPLQVEAFEIYRQLRHINP